MIASSIFFSPVAPGWIIGAVSVALTAYLIVNEFRRKLRFLVLRIISQGLSIFALCCLALHPSIRSEQEARNIMLLTENYDPNIADSLFSKIPRLEVIRTARAASYRSSDVVKAWSDLPVLQHKLKFVVGDGIPEPALDLLSIKNFKYWSSPKPAGAYDIAFKPFYANRTNNLTGIFKAAETSGWLRLESPGGLEDSVFVQSGQTHSFSLEFNPHITGQFLYRLSWPGKNHKQIVENLPIEILTERKLNVLVLQQFPTAEIRHLKNYLSENNHVLTLRYQVSRNVFRYEYNNASSEKIDILHQRMLQRFDLLIADNESLDQLTAAEKDALQQSVRAGLGIIMTGVKSPVVFPAFQVGTSPPDTFNLRLASGQKMILPLLVAKPSGEFTDVLPASHHRPVSGFIRSGLGKIGYQLPQETYSLRVKGEKDSYSALWTPLIESVARKKDSQFKITMARSPLHIHDPIWFKIISSGQNPEVYADSIRIPLKEDEELDDLWHGKVWISSVGWHALKIKSDSTVFNYYVSGETEWQTAMLARQQLLNSNFNFEEQKSGNDPESIVNEINPILFFLLFLLSTAFLWLAPRL